MMPSAFDWSLFAISLIILLFIIKIGDRLNEIQDHVAAAEKKIEALFLRVRDLESRPR